MDFIKRLSDEELLQNLRMGNRLDESIKSIYRDNFESLSRFVLNNSGNRQDAEDMFQEAVMDFIELVRRDKFRGESSVKTFLFSINKHMWLNELKRKSRADKREWKFESAQDKTEMDISQFIAGRETRAQVIQLVGQLGETCKKILVMFYYENIPMSEILKNVDYDNEQVVRNKKYKCLKQLEKIITGNPSLKQTLKNLLHG